MKRTTILTVAFSCLISNFALAKSYSSDEQIQSGVSSQARVANAESHCDRRYRIRFGEGAVRFNSSGGAYVSNRFAIENTEHYGMFMNKCVDYMGPILGFLKKQGYVRPEAKMAKLEAIDDSQVVVQTLVEYGLSVKQARVQAKRIQDFNSFSSSLGQQSVEAAQLVQSANGVR